MESLSKDLIISSLVRAADPELLSFSEFNDKIKAMYKVMRRTKVRQLKGFLEVKFPEYKEIIKNIRTIYKKDSFLYIVTVGKSKEKRTLKIGTSNIVYGVNLYSAEGTLKKGVMFRINSLDRVEREQITENEQKFFEFGGSLLSSPCLFFIMTYLKRNTGLIREEKFEEICSKFTNKHEEFLGKNLIVR